MNSFIPWIGGKKLLRKQIISMFPADVPERYIEVFGGAGWVLFGKDVNSKQMEVFNDINSQLINLYRCIKYHDEELRKELDFLLLSREQFNDFKEQINMNGLTDIQRAARYYYLVRASYGASCDTFGCNKKNVSSDMLNGVRKRLERVIIENKNYDNLIKVYDREKALFYCDPPYHKTEHYYQNAFTEQDHIHLKDCLTGIKGKFILSYNDDEFIRNLYTGFNIYSVERSNNLDKARGTFKELIITNY